MDPLTHSLVAVHVRCLGFKGWGPLMVLVLTSVFPDIDYAALYFGTTEFLRYHRGLSHSVAAALTVPILVAFLFGGTKRFLLYYALGVVGYGSHLLLDWLNMYGVRLLMPLDDRMFSLDLFYMPSPVILAILALGLVAVWLRPQATRAIAAVTMLMLLIVIGVNWKLHAMAHADIRGLHQDKVLLRVLPLPSEFIRWLAVVKTREGMSLLEYDMLAKQTYLVAEYPNPPAGDRLVELSKSTAEVQAFLGFARYPQAEVWREGTQTVVGWREAAYPFDHYRRLFPWAIYEEDGTLFEAGHGL